MAKSTYEDEKKKKKQQQDDGIARGIRVSGDVRVTKYGDEKQAVRNYAEQDKEWLSKAAARNTVNRLATPNARRDTLWANRPSERPVSEGLMNAMRNLQTGEERKQEGPAYDSVDYLKAQLRAGDGSGWKRAGNQVVYVTPLSPLPDPDKEYELPNGDKFTLRGNKVLAPAAYGISIDEYTGAMRSFDELNKLKEQGAPKRASYSEVDNEGARDFLGKWFPEKTQSGELPTMDEINTRWAELDDFQKDAYWMEWQANAPTLEGYMAQGGDGEQLAYQKQLDERQAAADDAIGLLGEDAQRYATGRKSDYYERYLNGLETRKIADDYGQEVSQKAGTTKAERIANAIMNPAYVSVSDDSLLSGDMLAYRNMSDDQRKTFLYLASQNEDAAVDYFDSLLKDEGYNKEAYFRRSDAIRNQTEDNWLLSTGKSILTAPAQIAGTAYSIAHGVKGEEIDPYSSAFAPAQMTQEPRDKTSEMITSRFGTTDEQGKPKDNLLSWLIKAGYRAATSSADSATSAMLGLGMAGGGAAMQGLWSMGGGARDAVERGADTWTGLLLGGVDAAIEAITEYLPMDHLIKTAKSKDIKSFGQVMINALKGGLREAPGEGLSTLGSYISDRIIMDELSNWDAMASERGELGAALQVAGEVLTDAFVGFLSGEGSNLISGTGSMIRNNMIPETQEAPATRTEQVAGRKEAVQEATEQPASVPATPIQKTEKGGVQTGGNTDGPAPASETKGAERKNSKEPENTKEGTDFKTEQPAVVRRNGNEQQMNVTGVEAVSNGNVFLKARNENGDTEIVAAQDVELMDPAQQELLTYSGLGRMNEKAARGYLENYDAQIATPAEYAEAFESAYEGGKVGLQYEKILRPGTGLMRHLTPEARMIAYGNGHAAWYGESKKASAQKTIVKALNKVAGNSIRITDEAMDNNGYYDRKTGEIVISSKADKGAFAYVAVHELGHKLKAENAQAWESFQTMVEDALLVNDVDVDKAIADVKKLYKAKGVELNTDDALEEVICNSAASILQDEDVLRDMIRKDRSLMEKVADFLREFLNRLTATMQSLGNDMSELGSWSQIKALKGDHENLQKIYDALMEGLEGTQKTGQQNTSGGNVVKMSAKESAYDPEIAAIKQQIERSREALNGMGVVASAVVPENMRNKRAAQEWAIELLKSTGYQVDRQGFGIITFNKNDIRYAMNYANTEAEKAAIAVLPKVLKRGVEIGRHNDHKNREKQTVTFAAPVELNGVRGNMAVVVNLNGNHYYTHRIVLPDGTAFKFETQKKETVQEPHRGVTVSSSLADATSTVSTDSVSEKRETVNKKLSIREDSDGNQLSEQQREYFADSKVRDETGRLMVMYHGTPNGKYDRFRSGTYFTPMKDYAEVYQNPSASSISVKRNADDPMTYQAYLNMEKPFDTRNAKERKIFMDEYYRQWGTGTPLMESGLPDWTDGMDLQEFIEEMGYEYDGLILDEGGVPDEKGGVKSRGLSYVIFDPSQAKVTDNKTPTSDERFRYSIRETSPEVQEEIQHAKTALDQVRGAHRINAVEADKLAGKMLKEANSTYDRKQLAQEIAQIFDYIERADELDMDYVDDMQTSLMARVMNESQVLDIDHEEQVQPLREYFKSHRISLTDAQRKEAASMAGSYNAYRRSLMGRVKLTNSGTPLDTAWSEMRELLPEWFPDVNEGDMPGMLLQLVDAMKPVYHTGMNVEEASSWLAGQLNSAYLSLPAVKAAARDQRTLAMSVSEMRKALASFEEAGTAQFEDALALMEGSRRRMENEAEAEAVAELRRQWDEWKEEHAAEREARFQLDLKRAKDRLKTDDLAMRRVYVQVMQKAYSRQRMMESAQRRETELRSKQRARAEAFVRTMTNWMEKPTDAKHVPQGLREPLKDVLLALDFGGKNTKVAQDLSARLDRLATAMEQAQEGEDENRTSFLERDQQMIDELRRVATLVRGNTMGRGVYDLTGDELKDLNKWLGVVKHTINEAGKMHGSNLPGTVEETAMASMMEMGRKKPMKDKAKITKEWEKYFGVDMLDSFTFFERLGTTSSLVFKGLRKGFDEMAQHTREAEQYTQRLLDGMDLKSITGRKAEKLTFEVGPDNRSIEMTRAQLMELYVLNKREQARGHIYGDGIRIRGDEDVRPHVLNKYDVEKMTSALTEQEKQIADGLQQFLSENCAEWGNQTSLKLLGYRKFGEANYWPISTDANARNTTKLEENFAANISAIKNQGMTKALTEGARNTIMIGDIFDTYTRHISNMAAYAGYAIPLSDFQRWYNARGVKVEIEQLMGSKGKQYINNFLMSVNGTAQQAEASSAGKLAAKFARNAKMAAVGANIRVIVQQPTSYARASLMMNPKYLTAALTQKAEDADLVNAYCSIAQWKRYGFYETNVGPNLREMIVGDQSLTAKAREIAMKPAAWGDNWTLNRLWTACELETQEEYPELKKGTEAYYQRVGQRMSEIVDRTQVVDSPFHRSAMMRSKNWMDQMLTNFMSEPTKTFNMLMSAINAYAENRKNPAAKTRMARAFGVWAATSVLTAAAAGIVDAFRDDDDEKNFIEKYLSAVKGNTLDAINPLGMIPGVKDVLSLLQGYEPSRLDQQSIQRIIWAAQEIERYMQGESKQNLYGVTYKVAQAFSSVTGIPMSNVMRDMNAIIRSVSGMSPTLNAEAQKGSYVNQLYAAMQDGDAKKQASIRQKLRENAQMSTKDIDTMIANKLSEDERIAKAYEAKKAGNIGDVNRTKNALAHEGFTGEMVDKAITAYQNRAVPKEKKEKDMEAQLNTKLYDSKDAAMVVRMAAGVEKGDATLDDVDLILSEIAADSTAKDPEKSVRSSVQSALKADYINLIKEGDAAGAQSLADAMTAKLGTSEKTLSKWREEAKNK